MSTPTTQTLAAGRAYHVSITAHEIHNGNDIIALAENEADAQRLAACWNACQGVPTHKLKPMMLKDAAYGGIKLVESLRELVTTLQEDGQGELDVVTKAVSLLGQIGG